MRIAVQPEPFDQAEALRGFGGTAGAIVTFTGIVRDDTGGAGPERRRRASVPTSSGQDTGTAPGGANPEPQPGV